MHEAQLQKMQEKVNKFENEVKCLKNQLKNQKEKMPEQNLNLRQKLTQDEKEFELKK